jgi:hypothetical protein
MKVSEIDAQIAQLQEQRATAIKEEKKAAIATVKELVLQFKLTKGDLRGKAMKQLNGE